MKYHTSGLAALALLLPASGAMAVTYVAPPGAGGNLLTNAYQTTYVTTQPGSYSLDEIDGTFSTTPPAGTSTNPTTQGLPDLFAIDITGLTPFSATTVGTNGSVFNTNLYLFDSTGRGIYFNDDDPSQIGPGGVQFGAGATLPADFLPVGEYYLGVAPEGVAPQSGATFNPNGTVVSGSGSNIFPYPLTDGSSFTAVDGPTGPGGAKSLNYWNVSGDDVETGSFQILLTGAAPVSVVPEASSVALLGVAGLLLAATACRRRKSSSV